MSNLPQRVGNYRLERRLGRGGTSEVWLGRHLHLPERVAAVKILLSHDDESIQRFQREAEITSQLRHPGIVQIYDYGQYQPFYCTIMECVSGGSLRQLLDRHRRLTLPIAVTIFRQVAAALDFAHSQQIIHRDVSPGNILLDLPTPPASTTVKQPPAEERLRALLTDFGIARLPNKKMTELRIIMGTPGFFSPEHLKGATYVTPQSDIFSLGVVLYTMLSGASPWSESPETPGFHFAPPPPLASHGVELPDEVDTILQTLLAPDVANRYLTAGAAVEALERALARHTNTTVKVRPQSPSIAQESATFEAKGMRRQIVEQVLGPRMRREPMQRAEDRAEGLRQPAQIVDLLDEWSTHGWFRLHALGHLTTLRKVSSGNLYFYRLQVLYETRQQPYLAEVPDEQEQQPPLEAERDRWQTQLPPPDAFVNDAGGEAQVRGSVRVLVCPSCQQGLVPCDLCKGERRVRVIRTVPPEAVAISATTGAASRTTASTLLDEAAEAEREVLEPCPACEGRGGSRCERCQGTGRLLQQKAFHWQREANRFEDYDQIDDVEPTWLLARCEPTEVYVERIRDGFHPDWERVPALAQLMSAALQTTNDDTRVVLSEVSIAFIPVTEIIFELPRPRRRWRGTRSPDDETELHRMAIVGFENLSPDDWRFLNWDRVAFVFGGGFLLLFAVLSLVLLFVPPLY